MSFFSEIKAQTEAWAEIERECKNIEESKAELIKRETIITAKEDELEHKQQCVDSNNQHMNDRADRLEIDESALEEATKDLESRRAKFDQQVEEVEKKMKQLKLRNTDITNREYKCYQEEQKLKQREDTVVAAEARLQAQQEAIQRAEAMEASADNTPPVESSPDDSQSTSPSNENQVIEPTFNVPQFAGQFDKWAEWKGQYDELIHNNPNINAGKKLNLLYNAQHLAVKHIIDRGLDAGNDYEQIYQLLNDTFNSKYAFTMMQLDELSSFTSPPDQYGESVRALSRLITRTMKYLVAVESHDRAEAEVVTKAIQAMPRSVRQQWNQTYTQTEMPNVASILSFLATLAESLDSTASAAPAQSTERRRRVGCHHCDGDHPLYLCADFLSMSILTRRTQVHALRLCANCLSTGHRTGAIQCRYGPCKTCNGTAYHNTVLCFAAAGQSNTR